jgi:hypothetical protein
MNKDGCVYSSINIQEDDIAIPIQLKGKDVRADLVAKVTVLSTVKLLNKIDKVDLDTLNILVVNRDGCVSHIKKVSRNIANRIPAQGFFVRGGPQTLATYTALAISSHGATFTFVGESKVLSDAISIAISLANTTIDSSTILTVVIENNNDLYKAKSVFINASLNNNHDSNLIEKGIMNELLKTYSQELLM